MIGCPFEVRSERWGLTGIVVLRKRVGNAARMIATRRFGIESQIVANDFSLGAKSMRWERIFSSDKNTKASANRWLAEALGKEPHCNDAVQSQQKKSRRQSPLCRRLGSPLLLPKAEDTQT
jgi:hypothetical protein